MRTKKNHADKISMDSKMQIRRIMPIVHKIEKLEPAMQALSDEELKAKTAEFRERLAKGETLNKILPEAYAVVREADRRVLGLYPFEVQLIGGILLNEGKIAEMKTGEGKTLVATMPAYLNALEGKGSFVVTVNDYLAQRDAAQMGQVYNALGMTCGCVIGKMKSFERRKAYNCDITYVTNNELGFDYLRDNMVHDRSEQVQRGLHFAIIDEADSVLIDEARTPLIISGQGETPAHLYKACNILAQQMERGKDEKDVTKIDYVMEDVEDDTGDFVVNEKDKYVYLTEAGAKKAEAFFHLDNLSDPQNLSIQHCIISALRANYLMKRDRDYIVRGGEVLIVDEFTGRVMPGRRYSDGLHQAIEAKERVEIKKESQTLATITFQNFFNKFDKKCGMTGTAATEKDEFKEIYGMNVAVVPTNKPVIREDLEDSVYKTKEEKYEAVVKEVQEAHEKGQPVLVGTVSVDVSEHLSTLFSAKHILHHVLNAKNDAKEAEIVSHAGEYGAVTIATNMAGRGTDIRLDDKAREAGGLYVIGTERHESRRIDNQLRGRSGRQGDPGKSKFFISLEDDLLRLFGSDRMMSVMNSIGMEKGEALSHRALSKAVETAQKRVEHNRFGQRKSLFDYDLIMNEQRESFYSERARVLDLEDTSETVSHLIDRVVLRHVQKVFGIAGGRLTPEIRAKLGKSLADIFPFDVERVCDGEKLKQSEVIALLRDEAHRQYDAVCKTYPSDVTRQQMEKSIILRSMDVAWMGHIDDMSKLQASITSYAYAQQDPLVEYKTTGFAMFETMLNNIEDDALQTLYSVRIIDVPEGAMQKQAM